MKIMKENKREKSNGLTVLSKNNKDNKNIENIENIKNNKNEKQCLLVPTNTIKIEKLDLNKNLIEFHKKTVNECINNLTFETFLNAENEIEKITFLSINNYIEKIYNQRELQKQELNNIITYVDWITTTEPMRTLIYLPTILPMKNNKDINRNKDADVFLIQKHVALSFEYYKKHLLKDSKLNSFVTLESTCQNLTNYIFSIPEEKEISFFETDGTVNKLNIPSEAYFKKNEKLYNKMKEVINFGLFSFAIDQNVKNQSAGFITIELKNRIYFISCVDQHFYIIDNNLVNDIFDLHDTEYHLSKMPLPTLKKEQIISYYPS